MAKYTHQPPPELSRYKAKRSDQRQMTRMSIEQNTCPGCGTVYKEYSKSRTCENVHWAEGG